MNWAAYAFAVVQIWLPDGTNKNAAQVIWENRKLIAVHRIVIVYI